MLDWSVLWLTGEFGNLEHIHGCQDLSDDLQKHVRSCQKLSEFVRNYQNYRELSKAIRSYQKLSEAIKSHQNLLEFIKDIDKSVLWLSFGTWNTFMVVRTYLMIYKNISE